MEERELKNAVEAVIFASGTPVELTKIAQGLKIGMLQAMTICDGLVEEYEKAETEARDAWLAFEKTLRAHHEDTIYAKRLYGTSLYHQGQ